MKLHDQSIVSAMGPGENGIKKSSWFKAYAAKY